MFWIIGGDALFRAFGQASGFRWATWWGDQLEHVPWAGFHAYDLVFPLFMFIAGVAIPYAITGKLESGTPKSKLARKIIIRGLLLVFLGFIYNGLLDFNFATQRYPSVLGQIGVAYLIAAMIVLYTRSTWARIAWLAGILAGNAVVQLAIPVPGYGAGVLTQEGCINSYIDRALLPGRLHGGVFDPEGILCMISASSVVLAGALAGSLIRSGRFTPLRNTLYLSVAGIALVLTAIILAPWYPFIKAAATSTFNLLTSGISLLLLAFFYQLTDGRKFQRWGFFLKVIGMNSITIYLATRMVDFKSTSDFLFTGFSRLFGAYEEVILLLGLLALEWAFLYFLYRKKIFLKI